ncbi:MAG: orotate phosphoribosyltransferase [Planctomycetota bacterium]|jgi:orotate phosphoribosyltransferase
MQDYQRRFIDFLTECGAFKLGSFTLKSGRVSPTFVNTGLIKDGNGLIQLGEAYAGKLVERLGADGFDSVFGPSYKGIPIAVATSIALAQQGVVKPCLFDRKERKTHGEEGAGGDAAKVLVGHRPGAGERIAILDDVMTTGATKYESVDLLRSLVPGVSFPMMVLAVDREEVGDDGVHAATRFTEKTGVPVEPAVSITELLDRLVEVDAIPGDDLERCLEYLDRYGTPEARAWVERTRA